MYVLRSKVEFAIQLITTKFGTTDATISDCAPVLYSCSRGTAVTYLQEAKFSWHTTAVLNLARLTLRLNTSV